MKIGKTFYTVVTDEKSDPKMDGLIMFDRRGIIIDSDELEVKERMLRLEGYNSGEFQMKKVKLIEIEY